VKNVEDKNLIKIEILKGTRETNSKSLIGVFLGWQFNAEMKSRFQMLPSRNGCCHTSFLSQYCRSDSYSKKFSDVQILVQISNGYVDVG